MIDHLLSLYSSVIDQFVIVVSPQFADAVRQHCSATPLAPRISYTLQHRQDGMLPAILTALPVIEASQPESVWITWCDQIAIRPATIDRLIEITTAKPHPDLVFPTVWKKQPYIHFDRDPQGKIIAVRHRREGDAMPETGEGDSGVFAFSLETYLERLPAFASLEETGRGTGERNFLPFIPWLAGRGTIVTFPVQDEMESMGVNTTSDARDIEQFLAAQA